MIKVLSERLHSTGEEVDDSAVACAASTVVAPDVVGDQDVPVESVKDNGLQGPEMARRAGDERDGNGFSGLISTSVSRGSEVASPVPSQVASPGGVGARESARIAAAWLKRVIVTCSLQALRSGGKATVELNDPFLGRVVLDAVMDGNSIYVQLAASARVIEFVKPLLDDLEKKFLEEDLELSVETKEIDEETEQSRKGDETEQESGNNRSGVLDLLV